jgi:hypothetical protein
MKFNFLKSQRKNKSSKNDEVKEDFTEYDKHVKFYYTNIINSLILFTYNSEQLKEMTPVLIDPLTELYEELQYAFTQVCFETVFRNKFIADIFKEDLLTFKTHVEEIPNEIWNWEFLDQDETWKRIRDNAEELLNNIGITSRTYNDNFATIISITGERIELENQDCQIENYLQRAGSDAINNINIEDVKIAIEELKVIDDEHGAIWVCVIENDENVIEVHKDLSIIIHLEKYGTINTKLNSWTEVIKLYELLLNMEFEKIIKVVYG